MHNILISSLALGAALTLSTAGAQSLSAAQNKLNAGDWQGAAKAAAALNTSDGYALAAEATTLGAGLSGGSKAQYQQAQTYAQKAISLNKNNAEAYFELARAQGRLAQSAGIMQSLSLAGSMKTNLQKAISLKPNLAGAYVALGLWHAELYAKGTAARAATGAKADQVGPNFNKAVSLEPNRIIHRLEYARALMLLGSANKAQAVAQLNKAVSLPANTFWDKRDKQAAQQLLAKLK
ncbi:hypothetical protein GCM10017783_16970 [Deinococcus piscis]|uniref:Tetratricopeptide repeat protein n=1 Tax=Deinococcus piscis TaxID=394230 RepID=A0ABQ3KCS6_9DEIO|nr:tetratricopeptide repeat protein [Deinococcus piscis]GHG04984.1 hypothetical protein GCM10017783_16970 [Deinococcus piscis]